MNAMFRSLTLFNYRLWFAGALVSNIGTWMQRTAQDWIVLTDLTDGDATAVGITSALQLGPQLALVGITGVVADRFDKRRVLLVTQTVMGALGLGLGLIVVLGVAQLWQVYLFALALGVTTAFDAPARQAFVSEVVPEAQLSNAVALNSASFNGARLIGPAVAGVLTAAIGAGWVFLLNGVTFAAMILALVSLRPSELRMPPRAPRGRGQLRAGIRYVRSRPDIVVILVVVFLIGTFGMNFPIFAATMAAQVFHHGAGEFGLLSSMIAIGSFSGALLSARRERPRWRILFGACGLFGVATIAAALMPSYWTFGFALIVVGFSAITLMTTANATVQVTTAPVMRGRVMALYMAIFMGGTPIGAPVVGAISDALGPRAAMMVGGASGFVALAVGVGWLTVSHGLRVRRAPGRLIPFRLSTDAATAALDLQFDELRHV
ncbi:MFS transporter [Galbitalea sp. SE-J8]|uniref:MFS transporter n=1 Tax=Galbitalea sp. SE-J8 TaxID=3054952 RepID=UPI00259CF34A|nr:MFS transporter [Galbitalea sp. SE-J8]MDM4763945.1 MFS transporter [Galbitalea sp. SE-J8]